MITRMHAARFFVFSALLAACETAPAKAPAQPPAPLVFLASQSGRTTADADRAGGNPFATAFVEALSGRSGAPTVGSLPSTLRELTKQNSDGQQVPDVPEKAEPAAFGIGAGSATKRVAMVLVLSDYSASPGAVSLPGAKLDADRVSVALRGAGFETTTVFDRMSSPFARRSTRSPSRRPSTILRSSIRRAMASKWTGLSIS